jgi:hypothetical protein
MNDLLKSDNPCMDVSTLNERRLSMDNHPVGNRRKMDNIGLSDEFKDYINQSNRMKPMDVICALNLGIKVRVPMFSLIISTCPNAKPFRMAIIQGLTKD